MLLVVFLDSSPDITFNSIYLKQFLLTAWSRNCHYPKQKFSVSHVLRTRVVTTCGVRTICYRFWSMWSCVLKFNIWGQKFAFWTTSPGLSLMVWLYSTRVSCFIISGIFDDFYPRIWCLQVSKWRMYKLSVRRDWCKVKLNDGLLFVLFAFVESLVLSDILQNEFLLSYCIVTFCSTLFRL